MIMSIASMVTANVGTCIAKKIQQMYGEES